MHPNQKNSKKYLLRLRRYPVIVITLTLAVVYCFVILLSIINKTQSILSLATYQNIAYCNSSDPSQTLDFYRPKGSNTEVLPIVIYIHGGGWRSGSKGNALITKTYGPLFISHHTAVASIDYRLHSKNPYPDQNNDVACALTYLSNNASKLKINIDQSILFGDSAGGQLAAFAALNIPYKNYDYEAPVGVIDFYGVSDFSKIVDGARPDFNARRYLGSTYNTVATLASPTTYVTRKAPRFLLIHGTNDKVVPIAQSKDLFNLLTTSGIDAEYTTIPGAGHGFIGPELSTSNYRLIQDSLSSFLQETIQR